MMFKYSSEGQELIPLYHDINQLTANDFCGF